MNLKNGKLKLLGAKTYVNSSQLINVTLQLRLLKGLFQKPMIFIFYSKIVCSTCIQISSGNLYLLNTSSPSLLIIQVFENWLKILNKEQVITTTTINIFKYQMDAEGKQTEKLLTDRAKLIQLINKLLEDILETTREMPKGNSKFHAKQVPAMSVRDYLSRISKYSHCSNSSYVMALIYIDRLQDCLDQLVINKHCIHKYKNINERLLISSIVLAAKYNDDQFYKNVYYAKVGGVSLQQMNMLENQFATILDYNFFVKPEDFNTYLQKLSAYDVINE